MLTVGERIILHLSQYSKFLDSYDVPLDLSQDGIATALRISRAHAAIELKKLRASGDVVERLAHIKRGKTKRKVYFLSSSGESKANNVKDFAEREGIEILPLLDLKRCRGTELWNTLDEKNRSILAQACVFRKPFRREALPQTSISLLPLDQNGLVLLPEEIRMTVPSLIPPDMKKENHSRAADYWLQEGDYRERLYHLIGSGRSKEAEMLMARKGSILLENVDEDLFQVASSMSATASKYSHRVRAFQAELASRTGHFDFCEKVLSTMTSSPDVNERAEGLFISSLSYERQGKHRPAFESLLKAREIAPPEMIVRMDVEMASILILSGQHQEARQMLEQLLSNDSLEGDILERIYFLMGAAALKTGNAQEALKFYSKSRGASRNKDNAEICSALSQAYSMLGMTEKSQEYLKKARADRTDRY